MNRYWRDCALCSETHKAGHPGYRFVDDGDEYRICKDCKEAGDYETCNTCKASTESLHSLNDGWLPAHRDLCERCINDQGYYCEQCGDYFRNLADGSYCYDCFTCECGDCDCSYCYPDGCDCYRCTDDEDSEYIHGYSYMPSLRFTDTDGYDYSPKAGTPYLGMELEVSVDARNAAAELLTTPLTYCKEDSTVAGIEIVSHPMTLAAAKEQYPFESLRTLRKTYGASGWDNGIHVHVSRDGFLSDLHVFRWMKLIYRNDAAVRRIARRNSDQWASFDPSERKSHKLTAEKRVGRKSRSAYTRRYSAINVTNDQTFEVRVFRGSLLKREILASLELVAASVEYTRHLSTTDILKNDGWSWASFISWCEDQGDTYAELLEEECKTAMATMGTRVA